MSTPSAKFRKSISLLFIVNLSVWIVAGSKLDNTDWNMWIDTDDVQLSNKRITAKSIFKTPCSEGFALNREGQCVKVVTVNTDNQFQFLMNKLNIKFGKKPESNPIHAGSEPFKLNIPLFNSNPSQDSKRPNGTNVNSQRQEITTRKQPHFTNLFDLQTTVTTTSTGKTELPSTTMSTGQPESTTWRTSTKQMPESTTMLNEKLDTVMWITEKPKNEQTDNKPALHITTTPYITTQDRDNASTLLFSTQTPPLFDKLGSTLDSSQTVNTNTPNTVYPSSIPPSTLSDNTKTTFIPSSQYNSEPTVDPSRISTTYSSPVNNKHVVSSTTTDTPFLIIVTDTNNHIVNTNESEAGETDYILISNSSHPTHVNKPGGAPGDVSHNKNGSEVKIVDKMCTDSELCNDESVLPYFESKKTIRNNTNKVVNHTNVEKQPDASNPSEKLVNKQIDATSSKVMNIVQSMQHEDTNQHASHADTKLNTSSLNNDKISLDSSHVYESLKMPPPSSPSKVETKKSDSKRKSESSTVQSLVNIVHPTSSHYSSTPVYKPSKKSAPTTQSSPILTTTKRIFTNAQSKPYSEDSNVYNLMYSLQPASVDYPSSNDYLFGSSSSQMEPQYGSYDTSSYVRFPSEQQAQPYRQHPNSKFSLDFQNTFGSDMSADAQVSSNTNSFVRFPTISRTPASTFNSNRWPNTRWPAQHQADSTHYDNSWNSRWPQQQQQQTQQYYNQNSRFQQNVPLTNYKLLQL